MGVKKKKKSSHKVIEEISRRNISNLRYTDDTTFMAESEEKRAS